ncbi:MAG: hypothetical protein EBQ99_07980, partial [Planctomycetes bacterium]|nr:hypothetical protein [Planctomycetota bacterium]
MLRPMISTLVAGLLLSPALAQQPPATPATPGKPIVAPNRPMGPKGGNGMVPIESLNSEPQVAPGDGMIPGQGMPPSTGEATQPVLRCEPDPLDLGEMVVDTAKSGKV